MVGVMKQDKYIKMAEDKAMASAKEHGPELLRELKRVCSNGGYMSNAMLLAARNLIRKVEEM